MKNINEIYGMLKKYSKNELWDKIIKQDYLFKILYNKYIELSDKIEKLQEKNKTNTEEQTLKSIYQIIEMSSCEYPPYILSKILEISSHSIVKIAETINIVGIKGICVRIPRIEKKYTRKSQTIILFSFIGIILMITEIQEILSNKKKNINLYKLIRKSQKRKQEKEFEIIVDSLILKHNRALDELAK